MMEVTAAAVNIANCFMVALKGLKRCVGLAPVLDRKTDKGFAANVVKGHFETRSIAKTHNGPNGFLASTNLDPALDGNSSRSCALTAQSCSRNANSCLVTVPLSPYPSTQSLCCEGMLVLAAAFPRAMLDRWNIHDTPALITPHHHVDAARLYRLDRVMEQQKMPMISLDKRVSVLINKDAGTVLETDHSVFSAQIVESFARNGYDATPNFVHGNELAKAFEQALALEEQLVVIAGGDGSANAVLPWAMATGKLFAVLPLGTLNLIGQDLGLTGNLDEDIAALANGRDISCDVIMANDKLFHSNAGLGFFVTMALERQAARRQFPFSKKLGFAWAALKTFFFRSQVEITYVTEEKTAVIIADAVLVTNNRFFGTPWRRNSLQDGVLELHVLKAPTLMKRLTVLAAVARGSWRDLEYLTTVSTTAVTIRRRRRKTMRVAMDGEIVMLDNPLRFTVLPGALRIRSGFPRSDDSIA